MVVQVLLESLSRCFGAPAGPTVSRKNNYESSRRRETLDGDNGSRHHTETDIENEFADTRRRQGRAKGLELQDEEWDNLFSREDGKLHGSPNQNDPRSNSINNTTNISIASSNRSRSTPNRNSSPNKKLLDKEITYPEAYARVQEAARSRSTSSSKRRREKKKDIFRERRNSQNTSLATRILGKDGVKALCFANPVHTEGVDMVDDEASACHTLDTADDTIDTTISNMYMERQYAANEPRPPMPLFNHFKVNSTGDSRDTLMGIITSGSHHSARVRHLFLEEATETSNNNKIDVNHSHEPKGNSDMQFTSVKHYDMSRNKNKYKETIECSGTPSKINYGSNSSLCKLENRDIAMLKRPPKSSGSDDFPPPVQKISGSNSTSMSSSFI